MAHCESCNDASTCNQCAETSYQHANKRCYACPRFCKSCSSGTQCDGGCDDGYYLHTNGYTCIACPAGCRVNCGEGGTCKDCADGYYLNADTKKCVKCKAGCKQCLNAKECLQCDAAYYFKPTGAAATRLPNEGTCSISQARKCENPTSWYHCPFDGCQDGFWYMKTMDYIYEVKP